MDPTFPDVESYASRSRETDLVGAHLAKRGREQRSMAVMATLAASSKLNAEWDFLTMLRDEGRKAAEDFLRSHGDDIGKRSTLDLTALLEGV